MRSYTSGGNRAVGEDVSLDGFLSVRFTKQRMVSEISIYVYRNRERLSDWQAVAIYPSRSSEQSNTVTVRELLASGRIVRVYLDELGEIEQLPIGVGLMVLTTLEGDAAKTEARLPPVGYANGDRPFWRQSRSNRDDHQNRRI